MDAADLSLPVLWAEGGERPLAGRLDLTAKGLHLDGGPQHERRTREIPLAEIAGVRIARAGGDRLHGRQALVVDVRDGTSVSIAGFDRPGTLHELAERLERLTRR